MFQAGEIVSYQAMCALEKRSLQHGMNFRCGPNHSVLLMSTRKGAPYADRVEDEGRVVLYEGHDVPRNAGGPDPKTIDQPEFLPSGRLPPNGKFAAAARERGRTEDAERVRIYEKIKSGI